jgi:LysM repeat protein
MIRPIPHLPLVFVVSALVAACSSAPRPQLSAGAPPSAGQSEVEVIASLLDAGEPAKAKKRVLAALKRDPQNANLMLLRDSIDHNPQELLGPNNFVYTVQPGDTIPGLAQRFLGNRLKSYQLARYNGISGPSSLSAGRILRIPGSPPRLEAPKPIDRSPEPALAVPRARIPPAPHTAATPQPSPRSSANSVTARQLRSAGLTALNEGNPGRAVGLLARAAALDPGNAAIARDLQRAQRINATVKARR